MKRIVVIGSGGAGKSTFARRLGKATGIEVIHLDSLYWKPNWQETPAEEWEKQVAALVKRDAWIMDGNFGGTRKMRVEASDTVVFLDIPRLICLYRVIKRTVQFRGKNRPDMAEGCNEKVDLEFLSWVWNFPTRSRDRIFRELDAFQNKRAYVLRSAREVESFIEAARAAFATVK